ncbi:MAG: response regulator [Peptococcaceae bacterium]|jgi:PAS domain S-box-containing protein|nr:response regulator [Peptococcaceae bacterium]
MRSLIVTREEACTGCNRCVRECPVETANINYQDQDGNTKVRIDQTKCIACGRCVSACQHDARYYEDDTQLFFADLAKGKPISLIAAPSICTNIPDYKKLFTWLRRMGVKKIYDVSLGADLCIWAYVKHLREDNPAPLITQPCPVVVTYCEKYRHDILKYLSPIHSPMGCLSVYMKRYEGIEDGIAAVSPCIAKANEFSSTGLADYNITFTKLLDYVRDNHIILPEEETGFDHEDSGIGSLFPMPGGLKENIEFFMGKDLRVDRAEGYHIYEMLDVYGNTPEVQLPAVFDVLNCSDGCNIGSAASDPVNYFTIGLTMDNRRKAASRNRDRAFFEEQHRKYESTFDLAHFMREYEPIQIDMPMISEEDIQKAFIMMDKEDEEKQKIDCGACGCDTCYNMAKKVALGVNIPVNCVMTSIDIAKREHEKNRFALEELETIWNHVESGIIIVDAETRKIIDVNPSAVRLFGAGSDDMIGKDCCYVFGQHECPILDQDFTTDRAERVFHKADGTIIPILKTVTKIVYNGRSALLESFSDISSLKTAQEKSRMLEVAEQANLAKSNFLARMSHEIRTPMNAILGVAEIQLRDENLAPGVKDALGKIYNSGDLLLGIINDILDLSKIEAGKLELSVNEYDTASLINDTVQLNAMRIGSKPVEFKLTIDEHTPSRMKGDELRIKQILNNLLSNAFKYTSVGLVTLGVSIDSETKGIGDTSLVLSVSDTGQGMTPEQIAKLFDEYSRFNIEANRTTEGTGLGMNITQNLIRLMNGEIAVASEPGKGSVFTVRLPQGVVGTSVLGKELVDDLQIFRENSKAQIKRARIILDPMPYGSVLIVDDVETNIYVAKGLLAPYGLKVESVDSGYAAIDVIKGGKVYDIIFMDHMMPEMDGMEATKIIRELGYRHPIVALTANAVTGQAEVFLENGFDDFVSKPIDIRQMNIVLNRLIRDKQPPEVIAAARRQAAAATEPSPEESRKPAVDIKYAEAFMRDVSKSITVLEDICEKDSYGDDEDIKMYIVHVHGMKSALANIGMMELSSAGLKLEAAGRERNLGMMRAETPAFICSLREVIEDIAQEKQDVAEDAEMTHEEKVMLKENLTVVKKACEQFDKKTVNATISTLKGKTWPQPVKDTLADLSRYMLHSDFDAAVEIIEEYV